VLGLLIMLFMIFLRRASARASPRWLAARRAPA
jgi:hypothetical protein